MMEAVDCRQGQWLVANEDALHTTGDAGIAPLRQGARAGRRGDGPAASQASH